MAELDDDDVAADDEVRDVGEAALLPVRARRAARDGLVDDGRARRVLAEVLAPAVRLAVGRAVLGHGRVADGVDGRRGAAGGLLLLLDRLGGGEGGAAEGEQGVGGCELHRGGGDV